MADPRVSTSADENVVSTDVFPLDPHATFYFLPNGIGKERRTIFTNAFARFRLQLIDEADNARFIVADDQFDVPKVFSILKLTPAEDRPEHNAPVVLRSKWLSDSLKEKSLVPLTKEYIVRPPLIRKTTEAAPSFSQPPARHRTKRTLSQDEPLGGSATQVKHRRFSSDDDDPAEVRCENRG